MSDDNIMAKRKTLILVHGLSSSPFHMGFLKLYFKRKGWRVFNVGYPSRKHKLSCLIDYVWETSVRDIINAHDDVHFLTHSMGGIVTRGLLHRYHPDFSGRVVQLAPPNWGSELADKFKDWKTFKWWFGPAAQQLTTDCHETQLLFGAVPYELGIVAGAVRFDPIGSFVFDGPHDGQVAVEKTKLEDMNDHVTIPVFHALIPYSLSACHYAQRFLKHGRFKSKSKI